MKRVLLVDDDPVVLRMYQDGLSQHGVEVETAAEGLAAINSLRAGKPDVVVLDLMMPKLTGVDVLKFIRTEANLKDLPVVVLSNSYMNQLATEAAALGVQKVLLKARCSLVVLLGAIHEVLEGRSSGEDTSSLLAVPDQGPAAQLPPAAGRGSDLTTPAPAPGEAQTAAEFQAKARRSFLQNGRATCTALRSLCQEVITASNEAERDLRLQGFCRKVHFITATAGTAGCHQLGQMASALEAMLFELIGKPKAFSPSVARTIAATVDFLALLFDCAQDSDLDVPLSAQALVVDDDVLSNRLVVTALQLAQLQARSTNDPWLALKWLKESRFDLVLLDIKMPNMDGFELCRRLRRLPGYQQTPVIYVTAYADFETRTQSVLSSGDDLISKPVFPLELTVKVVAQLLKRQITTV
jgi:CheY-like chemotaxis protein